MAEVQVKGEIENIGRNVQHSFERIGLPMMMKLFRKLFSTVYHQHIEGLKAIQRDGPTAELEHITNLSYEEVIDTLTKCQKDNIKAVASEFKKGNDEVEDEFGKEKSLSKMEQITKAQRQIEKYKTYKKRHPQAAKIRKIDKKISYWENVRQKAIDKHDGYRYNIIFNKSKAGYFANRIVDIKNSRLAIGEKISIDNPEVKHIIDMVKEKGLDLNSNEIRAFAGEFINNGNLDITEFKEDYILHTIDLETFKDIYKSLQNSGIDYGVDTMKIYAASENAQTNPAKEDAKVKIYVKTQDINEYKKLGCLDKGVIQSIGKIETAKSENETIENASNSGRREFEFPKSEVYKCIDKFKGKDYTLYVKDKDTVVLSIDKKDIDEVYETEKKRDVVQETIDEINKDKLREQQEQSLEVEKELDASPDTTNIEASDIKDDMDLEIEMDGDV